VTTIEFCEAVILSIAPLHGTADTFILLRLLGICTCLAFLIRIWIWLDTLLIVT
jgi:hypothetical protein